ncbi:MAG TPA: MarR family transcriptional regulator [Acidobacteriaceae bacterium]|jgi:DNA-binding MarR family transcriptional regulator|nr:MarR family transcriptional regulator [Acidobacteriaceae bacterium]
MRKGKGDRSQRQPATADRPILPRPGEGKRGEAGYVGYLLRQAAAAYRLRLERALADLKVTPPQFAVLTMLKAYPAHSNADIARIALLTPPTVTVILANLEKNGLVSRKPHAKHGRIQLITLTPGGTKLLATCRARALAIEEDLLAGLTRDEERIVKQWLVRVATQSDVA